MIALSREEVMDGDDDEVLSQQTTASDIQSVAAGQVVTLGHDMWKQLKRVSIPVFNGDRKTYANKKAAFMACIDSAPATAEYKLLQLRQYLSGDALKCIESLGHSAAAYQRAKECLERKFGRKRRQVAIYIEELNNFRPIRYGNARDLEKLADLLDVAVVNLKEAGKESELGEGSLYHSLQRKLPEQMVSRYHRWVFEKSKPESVETLRTWINQEADFQTIAHETVKGVTAENQYNSNVSRKPHTMFVGNSDPGRGCRVCGTNHPIWQCEDFKKMNIDDRWNHAKKSRLCFRCLVEGHLGTSCKVTRICGVNKSIRRRRLDNSEHQMQLHNHENSTSDLKNGEKKLRINALLDDASTKTYLNSDVAAELGLRGSMEKVTVNVINGQTETFITTPVEVQLESVNGQRYTRKTERASGKINTTWVDLYWLSIGKTDGTTNIQTNFVSKYFSKADQELSSSVQKFWEIENFGSTKEILSQEDRQALKTVEESLT
ncbi:uncharacterized protein LOC141902090 [Tubulanus polymorphus]|uniref:uncharacterized protein LOC141902090 n=1 Tax=Tubulanus polymorphus TaxID=672921 RepID=UPI003DA2E432